MTKYYTHTETGARYMKNEYGIVWLLSGKYNGYSVPNGWFRWQLRLKKIVPDAR